MPPPIWPNQPTERPGRIEYLFLTEAQKIEVEKMNDAIDDLPPLTRLRCQNPQIKRVKDKDILYYQHIDYDERTPPTEREADLMCKTTGRKCPIAAQCLKLGLTLEADQGVWGGRVLVDGKDYHQGGKNGSSHS